MIKTSIALLFEQFAHVAIVLRTDIYVDRAYWLWSDIIK